MKIVDRNIFRSLQQYKFLKGEFKKRLSEKNPIGFIGYTVPYEELAEYGMQNYSFAEYDPVTRQRIMPVILTPSGPLKKFLEHFSEEDIIKSPQWAYSYAYNRPERCYTPGKGFDRDACGWPPGEPIIASDPRIAYAYAFNCLGGRPFPLGEPAIAKAGGELAERYASKILKLPHPLCDEWAEKYLKGDFMEKQASGEMSRGKLMEALQALNDALGECDMKAQVTALGGAAILLSYDDFSRPVKDVDVFYDYKSSSPDLDEEIMNELIKEVGDRVHVHHEWMNNGVQPYIWLPSNVTYDTPVTLPNLTVRVPNPEYLFANKLDSGRKEEKGNDTKDVRFLMSKLGFKSPKEILAMYKQYYPDKNPGTFTFEEACQAIRQ